MLAESNRGISEQVYRVSVDLAKPGYAEDWVQGRLKASMYSPNGVIRADLTPAETKLEHGTSYTTVVAHPVDLGEFSTNQPKKNELYLVFAGYLASKI